ncbi:hypothetical protein ANANG_G00001620 [Anguilla anguilla]|uniref:Uncharacterized protein n=1 Tax=Anguilla anguilla TaxID=7936 RepID=A0A9D3S8T7_ANGAN|nr:hypothetical protein ANANG_G00001620 [Anguilla anguilla]
MGSHLASNFKGHLLSYLLSYLLFYLLSQPHLVSEATLILSLSRTLKRPDRFSPAADRHTTREEGSGEGAELQWIGTAGSTEEAEP